VLESEILPELFERLVELSENEQACCSARIKITGSSDFFA